MGMNGCSPFTVVLSYHNRFTCTFIRHWQDWHTLQLPSSWWVREEEVYLTTWPLMTGQTNVCLLRNLQN